MKSATHYDLLAGHYADAQMHARRLAEALSAVSKWQAELFKARGDLKRVQDLIANYYIEQPEQPEVRADA